MFHWGISLYNQDLVLLLKYCIKNFSNLGYIFVKGKINFELLLYY